MTEHKFDMGKLVSTPGALDLIKSLAEAPGDQGLGDVGWEYLNRHLSGDWGDVSEGDADINNRALEDGARLMSVYNTEKGPLWIITEWDRSATTFLLPSEY
jgi:hypothetical protein